MALRFDLGAQSFNTEVADGNGATWWITDYEGWDAPGLRQSFQGPTSRHGTVILESLLDSRSLVLKGICKNPTESVFWINYNYILGLVNNLYNPINLKISETTPKQCGVIRGGMPRLAHAGVGSFSFELPLIAIDPLKYNSTLTTVALAAGATATLTNQGNFDAPVVATLTAAGTVALKNITTGQTILTGSTSLNSGAVLDTGKRTVYEGTVNKYNSLDANSVWWSLQPGGNSIQNNGTAPVSFTYRDSWL